MSRKLTLKTKSATANWERMFKVLRFFKKAHAHCGVPTNADPNSLGHWLAEQRREQHAGRLAPEYFQRLEKLGVVFEEISVAKLKLQKARAQQWDERLAELVAFKERFGHCDVPCHSPEYRQLGGWISNQRSFRCRGTLRQDRIDRLDEIGVRWVARFRLDAPPQSFQDRVKGLDQLWEFKFAELVRFKNEQGHCRVPSTDSAWRSLFRWAGRQRDNHRAGNLPAARRQRLDALGFPWEPVNPAWELKFEQLLAYKKQFGHCDIPARWPGNKPLAYWVHNQRGFKNHGTLSAERIGRLNKIGFAWGQGRWG